MIPAQRERIEARPGEEQCTEHVVVYNGKEWHRLPKSLCPGCVRVKCVTETRLAMTDEVNLQRDDADRKQRLLTWAQGCIVRAAHALALAVREVGLNGASVNETAVGVSSGLLEVDAAITKGEPP